MGYGVFQVTQEECERCVPDALKTGYRAVDTAQSYFNEEQVGAAIEKSGVDRKDIFLTTKVWIEHYGYEKPRLTDTHRFGQPQNQATLNKAIRRIIRNCNDKQFLGSDNPEVLLPHFSSHSLRYWGFFIWAY